MSEWLDIAIDFLEKTDLTNLPLGRTEIFVDKVFANVMEAQSLDETAVKFEIHKDIWIFRLMSKERRSYRSVWTTVKSRMHMMRRRTSERFPAGRVLPASWDRADLSYAWEKNRISRVLQRTKISI